MSRSGYVDDDSDYDFSNLWRGAVIRSIRGKRGQSFLHDLLAALDAMPEKRLVAGELEAAGSFCALGVAGQSKGLNLASIDTYDYDALSKNFNISEPLAREIMYINDELVHIDNWECLHGEWVRTKEEKPEEKRWEIVRKWVDENIVREPK